MKKRENQPVFVVFEGLDGAGKSTAAHITAEKIGAEYLTTPSPMVRSYREEIISSFDECQEACQLFYLSTVFAASQEVQRLLSSGRSVVLDRYFLSTQAYAEFRGTALKLDDLGEMLVPADLTVFLEAPLAIRRVRIAERGESPADRETLSEEADACLREAHEFRSRHEVIGSFLSIDTGEKSQEEVARDVLAFLAQPHPAISAR